MAGTRRQDRDVTRIEFEFPAAITAETNPCMATGDAERLVNGGVIVQIVVDAVAPHIAPAMGAEQLFDGCLGRGAIELDRAFVDQERQRIVRNEAVIREDEGGWFKFYLEGWQNRAPR